MSKTSLQKAAERASKTSGKDFSGAKNFSDLGKMIAGSSSKKKKNTGIEIPNIDIGGKSSGGGFDASSLFSGSSTAIDTADLERQTEKLRRKSAKGIKNRFGARIDDVREDRDQTIRATGGALGTGRRFSSSAQAFISFQKEGFDKNIAAYEVQMENALINNDIEFANLLDKKIAGERTEQRAKVDDMFQILNLNKAISEYETEKNQPMITASREAAVADLIGKGVEDVGQIQNMLNFQEDGTQVGDFSLDEVNEIVENLQTDGGLAQVVADNPVLFTFLTTR